MPHTPGPWKVTTCLDYWVEPANAPDDDEFRGIALCGDISWPGSDDKQQEWEANARLIAAAPDLLEALRPIAAIADIFDHSGGTRPQDGELHSWTDHRVGERTLTVEMLRAARAVIAKAEGRS